MGTFTNIGAIGTITSDSFSCFYVKNNMNITHFFYTF
jgi:hypothetical protein